MARRREDRLGRRELRLLKSGAGRSHAHAHAHACMRACVHACMRACVVIARAHRANEGTRERRARERERERERESEEAQLLAASVARRLAAHLLLREWQHEHHVPLDVVRHGAQLAGKRCRRPRRRWQRSTRSIRLRAVGSAAVTPVPRGFSGGRVVEVRRAILCNAGYPAVQACVTDRRLQLRRLR